MRKRRFFYHYNKQAGKMTIHYKNQCILVKHIECRVPAETKYRSKQPRLVMQGFCSEVLINDERAVIQ